MKDAVGIVSELGFTAAELFDLSESSLEESSVVSDGEEGVVEISEWDVDFVNSILLDVSEGTELRRLSLLGRLDFDFVGILTVSLLVRPDCDFEGKGIVTFVGGFNC